MAGTERSIEEEKAQLVAQLDETRREISTELNDVAVVLDFPGQMRDSMKAHKIEWTVGALVAGIGFALLLWPKRAKKAIAAAPMPKKSILTLLGGALFNGALTLAKPQLTKLANQELDKWLKKAANGKL